MATEVERLLEELNEVAGERNRLREALEQIARVSQERAAGSWRGKVRYLGTIARVALGPNTAPTTEGGSE